MLCIMIGLRNIGRANYLDMQQGGMQQGDMQQGDMQQGGMMLQRCSDTNLLITSHRGQQLDQLPQPT